MSIRLKVLVSLFACAVLASCGGGGGGGGAAEAPKLIRVTVTAVDSQLPSNRAGLPFFDGSEFVTQINARVVRDSGGAVPDGTVVTFSVDDSSVGILSSIQDPNTLVGQLTAQTSGGDASVLLHTRANTGQVVVRASAQDLNSPQNVSNTTPVNVVEGPEPVEQLVITATRTTMPANSLGIDIFFGSPFITVVDLAFRDRTGTFVCPTDAEFGASISPVDVAAFSTLDDPATEDINEFFVLLGNSPVGCAAGKATIFVHSGDGPGVATLTINGQDSTTGQIISAQLDIEIVESSSDGVPRNVDFIIPGTAQYVQGSGGVTAKQIQLNITDGGFTPLPDPQDNNPPYNNVQLQIVDGPGSADATLSAVGARGNNLDGRNVTVATVEGIATATLNSGTEPGSVIVRATVDQADGNIDNGIQNPRSAEASLVISDGKLHSLKLATPFVNSIRINQVDNGVVVNDPNATIPLGVTGVYTLTVTAVGTDRLGNPPIQATELNFTLIDAPISGFPGTGDGFFELSGLDGNPLEDTISFTAPLGEFQTAGGGAGPGDLLYLFGEDSNGNEDHEGFRVVDSIASQTRLSVNEPFNLNDTTGTSVNTGNNVPYIIGRSTDGNIGTSASLSPTGTATVELTYPVSTVGRIVAVGVQAATTGPDNRSETVGDVEVMVYPGIAPATLTASPNVIPSNATVNILVCYEDFARTPIQGAYVGFSFNSLSGTGRVDGVANAGTVANPTGADGCTVATATTNGQVDQSDGQLIFAVGEATAEVTIVQPGEAVLIANPSGFRGDVAGAIVTLRLLEGNGTPLEGVQLSGECSAQNGTVVITDGPGVTDVNGETIARVSAVLNGGPFDEPIGSGSCDFAVASGNPSVTVTFQGIDLCSSNFSPQRAGCETGDPDPEITVSIVGGMGNVTSTPAGIDCTEVGGSCSVPFPGSNVILLATPAPGFQLGTDAAGTGGFTGDCSIDPTSTGPNFQTSVLNGDNAATCVVRFTTVP